MDTSNIPIIDPLKTVALLEQERVMSVVEAAEGQARMDFVETSIAEWFASDKYQAILEGERYYRNQNDILGRERTVIGRNGEMVAAPYLANNKLAHSFLRKLTRQKIGYLLAKPFTFTSDNEAFQEALGDYLDRDFRRKLKRCGKDSVVGGIAWIQPYYDAEGILHFKRIPNLEIIPFWADIDHTILEALIRVYEVEVYNGGDKDTIQYVKYYTKERVYNYIRDEDGLHEDPDKPFEANFAFEYEGEPVVNDAGEEEVPTLTQEVMWDRIPFVAIKYNAEEDSLLTFIKPDVDDYDRRTSDLSNTLEDEPNKIKVVRDYDGTDKGEFIYNLARYRTLFLRGSGEVTTLDTSISTDALENHLNRTRRDIFEFGGGVDTQTKELGNASGVALKFVYSDLDMDCHDFGNEIAASLEQLVWFIKQDLKLKTGQDFTDARFDVTFNTDITINETETITNIKNSVGIVSNKTLREQHPYVTDASEEEKQFEEEQQKQLASVEAQMRMEATVNKEFAQEEPPVGGSDERDE